MTKKTLAILLITLCTLNVTGCGSEDNTPQSKKEDSRLSLVTIKESGNTLITKGGEIIDFSGDALKSGGKAALDGSKTAAKKTGDFFSLAWDWTKDKSHSAGEWMGEMYDSITNSDPLRKEMVATSLKNLNKEVDAYNNSVKSSQISLDKLYEDKNKTTVTLTAVSKYAETVGSLPLGYSDKITDTKKDFVKYNEDLLSIKNRVKGNEWKSAQDMTKLGDAATMAGGTQEDAQTIDAAGDVLVKIASACGKEDATNLIDAFKGAAKMAVGISSVLAVTGADMGVSSMLVVAGPIVLKMVDTASNAYSERVNNKKLSLEADTKAKEVATARNNLEQFNQKVIALDGQITQQEAEVSSLMSDLLTSNVTDYAKATEENKKKVNLLIDKSNHLAKLLVTNVK